MILTDGSPADIDERVPQHLHMDAEKADAELHSQGLIYYCNTLDPSAHHYVQLIFGHNHYIVIDNVQCLPEN
jgi:nitric oxide reductase NorD protein